MNRLVIELTDGASIEGYMLFRAYMIRKHRGIRNDEEMWAMIRSLLRRDEMDMPEIINLMDTIAKQEEEIKWLKQKKTEDPQATEQEKGMLA